MEKRVGMMLLVSAAELGFAVVCGKGGGDQSKKWKEHKSFGTALRFTEQCCSCCHAGCERGNNRK